MAGKEVASTQGVTCLVCSTTTTLTFFGVDVCRACADFFKRVTVAKNKKLVCRQGTNKCVTTRERGFMCRSCRYDRCIALGLGRSPLISPTPCDTAQPSTSEGGNEERWPLLNKIKHNYRWMSSVRRAEEIATLESSPGEQQSNSAGESRETPLLPVTYERSNIVHRIFASALSEFSDAVFDGFCELSEVEKRSIFRYVFFPFLWSDGLFRTDPNEEKRRLGSIVHYFSLDELDKFFADAPAEAMKSDAEKVMREQMITMASVFIPLFKAAAMDEMEFSALVGLIFSSPSVDGLSDAVQSIAESHRGRIFHELHLYYKNSLGLDQYAPKIGQLMFLLSTMQEHSSLFVKDMEIYRLLNLIDEDTFMYSLHYSA